MHIAFWESHKSNIFALFLGYNNLHLLIIGWYFIEIQSYRAEKLK